LPALPGLEVSQEQGVGLFCRGVVSDAGAASHAVEVVSVTLLSPKRHRILKLGRSLAEQSGINQQKEAVK